MFQNITVLSQSITPQTSNSKKKSLNERESEQARRPINQRHSYEREGWRTLRVNKHSSIYGRHYAFMLAVLCFSLCINYSLSLSLSLARSLFVVKKFCLLFWNTARPESSWVLTFARVGSVSFPEGSNSRNLLPVLNGGTSPKVHILRCCHRLLIAFGGLLGPRNPGKRKNGGYFWRFWKSCSKTPASFPDFDPRKIFTKFKRYPFKIVLK